MIFFQMNFIFLCFSLLNLPLRSAPPVNIEGINIQPIHHHHIGNTLSPRPGSPVDVHFRGGGLLACDRLAHVAASTEQNQNVAHFLSDESPNFVASRVHRKTLPIQMGNAFGFPVARSSKIPPSIFARVDSVSSVQLKASGLGTASVSSGSPIAAAVPGLHEVGPSFRPLDRPTSSPPKLSKPLLPLLPLTPRGPTVPVASFPCHVLSPTASSNDIANMRYSGHEHRVLSTIEEIRPMRLINPKPLLGGSGLAVETSELRLQSNSIITLNGQPIANVAKPMPPLPTLPALSTSESTQPSANRNGGVQKSLLTIAPAMSTSNMYPNTSSSPMVCFNIVVWNIHVDGRYICFYHIICVHKCVWCSVIENNGS